MSSLTRNMIACLALGLQISAASAGAERNEVPSCYASLGIKGPAQAAPKRDLVIVVDKTVVFPKDILVGAVQSAQRFLKSGDRITIYSFSAFVPGQHMNLEWAGLLEDQPSKAQQADIPVMKIKRLERCLVEQVQYAAKNVEVEVGKISSSASNDIPKSEIIFSLRKLGEDMRSRKMSSPRLLLVSDMLENSDYFTFYAGNTVAINNPDKALKNLESENLLANLSGAKVYVTGAGTVTPGIKTTYRSGALIDKLESFWGGYFKASNAEVQAFGAPKMLSDIQ